MTHALRTLVIGGAGFIGANLCRQLLRQGCYVICLDDLSTGSLDNVSDIHDTKFIYRTRDLLSLMPEDLSSNLDYIYLLACPASPKKYQADPVRTLDICFNGTINALRIAKKTGAKLIFTSTSEIYGNPIVHPQSESYTGNVNTQNTRACYDEGKRVAETLIMEYSKKHNVDYAIARIFNTYGPYMSIDDGRVISTFIDQCKSNLPLTVEGDGSQTRSFCYIDDMVKGLIALAKSSRRDPINLGNPEEISILDLAKKINLLGNNTAGIIHKAYPTGAPVRRKPDITRAQTYLDWSPTITLDQGIALLLT